MTGVAGKVETERSMSSAAASPLVSVVIPTFARAELVQRAIRSVFAQTHRNIEVIVVVDGDDPETASALAKIADPRFRYIVHEVQQGAGPARDTGALAARGEWVAFLDDDDDWLPTKIERQLALAPADRPALLMTLFRCISPDGDLVKPARLYKGSEPIDEWLFDRHSWARGGEGMLQTSALMLPRSLFEDLRFKDTKQHEEWELAIRAVKEHGCEFVIVPEPLVNYYVPTNAPSLSKTYTWQRSLEWANGMTGVMTPRAYAGFCLTVVTQAVSWTKQPRAYVELFRAAFARGRPTARQLFAFAMIIATPHRLRKALRGLAGRTSARNG
jgi:glycosyltransferase involved in cell wall biosynthesis